MQINKSSMIHSFSNKVFCKKIFASIKTPIHYFFLITFLAIFSISACSPKQSLSEFEISRLKRLSGETERNKDYINSLNSQCEKNLNEISSISMEIEKIHAQSNKQSNK